jgi:hypothetical protein
MASSGKYRVVGFIKTLAIIIVSVTIGTGIGEQRANKAKASQAAVQTAIEPIAEAVSTNGLPDLDLSAACRYPFPQLAVDEKGKELARQSTKWCLDRNTTRKAELARQVIAPDLLSFCSAGARLHQSGYEGMGQRIEREQGLPRIADVKRALGNACGNLPEYFDERAYKECALFQAQGELRLVEDPGSLRFSDRVDICITAVRLSGDRPHLIS